ncbi:MAG: RDD family protein [Lysobacter sp.]|nr:MAG: RDD family protein [Lysobacter sp.]
MNAWYYSDINRNRLGPVATQDLADLHANGQLAPEILLWREGMPEWRPWREMMAEVLGAGPAPGAPARLATDGPAAPSHGGSNPYAIVERVQASPYAAPRTHLNQAQAHQAGGEVIYAGFLKRFAAYFIDSFVVGIAGFVLQMLLMVVVFGGMAGLGSNPAALLSSGVGIAGIVLAYLAPLALGAAYFAGFHASGSQATPGKMAVGIKVTDEAGYRIGFWRGVGRYFALLLACLILLVGVVMAAFTDRKRGLHDMMCGTLVVDGWAFTAHPERQRRELGTVTVVILSIAGLFLLGYVVLIGFAVILGATAAAGAH